MPDRYGGLIATVSATFPAEAGAHARVLRWIRQNRNGRVEVPVSRSRCRWRPMLVAGSTSLAAVPDVERCRRYDHAVVGVALVAGPCGGSSRQATAVVATRHTWPMSTRHVVPTSPERRLSDFRSFATGQISAGRLLTAWLSRRPVLSRVLCNQP